jgi:hypothetical protein
MPHASLPSFQEAFPDFYFRSDIPHHNHINSNAIFVGTTSPLIIPYDTSLLSELQASDSLLLPPRVISPSSTFRQQPSGVMGGEASNNATLAVIPVDAGSLADESIDESGAAGPPAPKQRLGRRPAANAARWTAGGSRGRNNASYSPLTSPPSFSPSSSLLSPVMRTAGGPGGRVSKATTGRFASLSSGAAAAAVAAAVAAESEAVMAAEVAAGTTTITTTGTINTAAAAGQAQRRDQKNNTEKTRRANSTAWLCEMQARLEAAGWSGSRLSISNHRKSNGLLKYNKLEIMEYFVAMFDDMERLAMELREPRPDIRHLGGENGEVERRGERA